MQTKIPYPRVLNVVDDAVILVNNEGKILFANDTAQKSLAVTESMVDCQIEQFFFSLKDLLKRGDQNISIDIKGRKRRFALKVCPLAEPEICFAVIFKDITDIHQLSIERHRLLQLATVGELLPTILHELKNPLAAITTAVELMIEDIENDPLQSRLHAILMELRRMKFGFEGLGSVGQNIRSARSNPIDFAVKEACEIFHAKCVKKQVKLTTQIDNLTLLKLDIGVVRCVVFNLLNNALDACQSGDTIFVIASTENKHLIIKVKDEGCGMPADTLEKCKQLFFTTKSSGSGIGLALCHDAIKNGNGHIDIKSEPNKGTEITISIPIDS